MKKSKPLPCACGKKNCQIGKPVKGYEMKWN